MGILASSDGVDDETTTRSRPTAPRDRTRHDTRANTRDPKWATGGCLGARGTQPTGGRAMSRARTPSMQGGRCATASHQTRGHSVTVPRDGATPRSAVPSNIWQAGRPLGFSRLTTRLLDTIRCAAAAHDGVELPLRSGYPTPAAPPTGGFSGRVSGYVPKSPCATSLNPGLGRAKSLHNRIVCPRRTSLRKSTWPRLGTRARNFERCHEDGVAMRNLADLRLRPIPEKQAPDPGSGRPAPRPPKDGPARR